MMLMIFLFLIQVLATLHEAGFHADIDASDRTIQKKVLPNYQALLGFGTVSFNFLFLYLFACPMQIFQ
jgi:threonyl-tRNA synthetase